MRLPRFCVVVYLITSVVAGAAFTGARADTADIAGVSSETALAALSDSELRQLLLEQLRENVQTQASTEFNPAITVWRLQQDFGRVRDRFNDIVGAYRHLPAELLTAWERLTAPRESGSFLRFVFVFLLALGGGWLAERHLRKVTLSMSKGEVVHRDDTTVNELKRERLANQLSVLGIRFVFNLAYLICFLAVASLIFFLVTDSSAQDRVTFFFYLSAVGIVRFISALFVLFLSPREPQYRLARYSDGDAISLFRGIRLSVILVAFGFFTCALFGTLGVGGDAHPLLLLIVGTAFIVVLSVTVYRHRKAISTDLQPNGQDTSRVRSMFATLWPWVAIITFNLIWLSVVYQALLGALPLYGAGIVTILFMLLYPSLDAVLEREATVALRHGEDVGAAVARIVRIGGVVCVGAILASLWKLRLVPYEGDGPGQAVAQAAMQIGLTLLFTYVIWQAVRIWIDRQIALEDAEMRGPDSESTEIEIGGEGMSRTRTLLPLLRITVRVTLFVIAGMIVMSAMGINIGPILAGAGVVGLAIGFGSQTLVRDVVSGVFFLVDDAFRLGEYVDVGEVKGTVEKISIRSLRLRHHRGALHTVPFGEIASLTNYSRDWAIMKLKFRVPFETDIEKVRKILKKVGQGLLEHPDVGEDFLQPFKSQGVYEVDDYGLVVRAKFMCKPGKQFLIRRHAYVAVQQAFAENNVDFAQPEIRVLVGDEESEVMDGDSRDKKTAIAGAAAQRAVTQPLPEPQPS